MTVTRKELKNRHKEQKQRFTKKWWTEIHLICSKCKTNCIINSTQPELYTSEIKQKWNCLLCSSRQKRRNYEH